MDKKPKAGGAPKKAKPKTKAKDEKQFERFIETARKLGVDESGKEFERAISSVFRPKARPQR
jgi:hypothetical protein